MATDDEEKKSAETDALAETHGSGDSGEMSFFEHLEELRFTLVWSAGVFFAAGILSLVFSKEIFEILRWPLEHAAGVPGDAQALVVMRFMDTFSILLYIALLGGIVFAGPAVLYRIGKFVAPALNTKERVRLIPFCSAAGALFLAGAALAFFWLAPVSISLPYWLAGKFGMEMNWLAEDYYMFVVLLTLFSGLMFEFPLIVVFLIYSEIVEARTMLEKWRWVLTGILVAGVLISPIGDPVALLVFSGLLFAAYLFSVYIGGVLLRRKRAREGSGDE